MRVADIQNLISKCTGCMACSDVCPAGCISSVIGKDGFIYSETDIGRCINCGKCYAVCPIEHWNKHENTQHLYAAYSIDAKVRNDGSSGGIFALLADYFLKKGYYVCGAAFENMKLRHRIINDKNELAPLLKSKYIQSDTEGIYKRTVDLLNKNQKVFFCGTPCQISALKNITRNISSGKLFTADIICHGVPSQKVFDMYIESLEKKHKGKIYDFSFRVKNNRYKHAHGFSYKVIKNGKTLTVNGIYTQSSFYNAFKNYLIFRNSCYDCRYATLQRVSDITLADFWGIEKYGFGGSTDKGVSMVITNTEKGEEAFENIKELTVCREFPIEYGIKSNYCLTRKTPKNENRDCIITELHECGYEHTAKKYFSCGRFKQLYWLVPAGIRNLIRKIKGRNQDV